MSSAVTTETNAHLPLFSRRTTDNAHHPFS
jgi:hypothetical protein